MNTRLLRLPAILVFSTCLMLLQSRLPAAPTQQAEMLRNANGRVVLPSGLAGPEKQLPKGMILDVVSEGFADVTVTLRGQKLVVSKKDVTLTEKQDTPKSEVRGFTPGQLVITSAKYSLEGNQPRNVKGRLEKYLPQGGMLSKPFTFMVSDDLSTAAANQKTIVVENTVPGVVILPNNNGKNKNGNGQPKVVVVPQTDVSVVKTSPNVLRVEYTYNGVKKVKIGVEGKNMTLP